MFPFSFVITFYYYVLTKISSYAIIQCYLCPFNSRFAKVRDTFRRRKDHVRRNQDREHRGHLSPSGLRQDVRGAGQRVAPRVHPLSAESDGHRGRGGQGAGRGRGAADQRAAGRSRRRVRGPGDGPARSRQRDRR